MGRSLRTPVAANEDSSTGRVSPLRPTRPIKSNGSSSRGTRPSDVNPGSGRTVVLPSKNTTIEPIYEKHLLKREHLYVLRYFEFIGNRNGYTVTKDAKGDGELGTHRNVVKFCANLNAGRSASTARLTAIYNVWESDYYTSKKNDRDCLRFTATQNFDLSNLAQKKEQKEEGDRKITIYQEVKVDTSNLGAAIICDSWDNKVGKWLSPNYNATLDKSWFAGGFVTKNELPIWLDASSVEFKMSGNGNDLSGTDNLGVRGYIHIPVIVETYKTIERPSLTQLSVTAATARDGVQRVLDLETSPAVVERMLGCGFDLTETDDESSTRQPVFDINAINKAKRISKSNSVVETFLTEGSDCNECSSKYEENWSVDMSFKGFGATAKSTTTSTYSESSKVKTGYKYKIRTLMNPTAGTFSIDGANDPSLLVSYLHPNFLADLNDPSMTAVKFIQRYGTHVVMGMNVGSRLSYIMKYKESTQEISKSQTFSNSSSVEYSWSASPKMEPSKVETQPKTFDEYFNELLEKYKDVKDLDKVMKQAEETYNNQYAKKTGSSAGGSVSGSFSYSQNSSSTSSTSSTNLEVTCKGLGGNETLIGLIAEDKDNKYYEKWAESASTAEKFIGFARGGVKELYKYIPSGYHLSAADIKQATINYFKGKGLAATELKTTVLTCNCIDNPLMGKDFVTTKQGDSEVASTGGKRIDWQIEMEPVTLEEEGTVGMAITYSVYEKGFNTDATILKYFKVIPFKNPGVNKCVGLESGKSTINSENGGYIIGQEHGWVDVTRFVQAQDHPYIDCDQCTVHVKVDGSGCDRGNIGLKCMLRVKAGILEEISM